MVKKIKRLLKIALLSILISHLVYVLITKWVNPPITITQLVSLIRGEGLKRDYVHYDEMGSNIKLAVMAAEDQLFPDHNGFDIKSIQKAIKHNQRNPNRKRGASTISQQTAKNVFLWQGGGFFRKGLEVYFTFMIETIWGKERILETYLNVAEMGTGIYGVQAAAKSYFGKNADELNVSEAAAIAACLPNPKKFKVKKPSPFVMRRTAFVKRQMQNLREDPDVEALLK